MTVRSFARLVVTAPIPEDEDRCRPTLAAGDEVWSFDGPTDDSLRLGERAVTLTQWTPADPHQPWYPVPAGSVEEA
jgi:hypothetical protein